MSQFKLRTLFKRKAVIPTKEQDDEWVAGIADMEQECVRCEAHYAETVQRLRRAKSVMKERNEDTLSERYHELSKAEAEMFACESGRAGGRLWPASAARPEARPWRPSRGGG